MRKALLIVILCLCVPAAARAAGRSLYDITASAVSATQKFNYCMTGNACSQDDYLALKQEAGDALRNALQLFTSGSMGDTQFTAVQAGDLISAITTMKNGMVSVQSPGQQACGAAVQSIIMAWLSFVSAFVQLFSPDTAQAMAASGGPAAGLALYAAQSLQSALFAFATGIVLALLGIILYPACLL